MHKFDQLTPQSETAFQNALDAVATHNADLGLDLEPIGDLSELEAKLFSELDEVLKVDITALPHPATAASTPPVAAHVIPTAGTVKISLRVPSSTLAAFKARAAERRQPYQKLLNQALRDAMRAWETPAGKAGHV